MKVHNEGHQRTSKDIDTIAEVERFLDQAYYYTPVPTKQPRKLDRDGALTLAVISTSVLVGMIIALLAKPSPQDEPGRTLQN
jgi:hypothetical protein